jgi:hypothetical protein
MAKLVISIVLFLAAAGPVLAQPASTKAPAKPAAASTGQPNDQFTTEAAAKAHCPGGTVVWATLSRSKAYHLSSDRYYGKTRRGAYMCQADADKDGMHQAGRGSTTSKASTTGTGSGAKTGTTGTSH